ncbi:MAG: response regulator [Acidobacteria bacterium]|nr:response regulator [Acidobacteriota bacterium]
MGIDITAVAVQLRHQADATLDHPGRPAEEFDLLKGHFLASLNHELCTPLSGVLGMADLLGETRLDFDQREYLEAIRDCASQSLEALNTLLDFSALSAGNARPQDAEFALPQLLTSVATEAERRAAPKGPEIVQDFSPALPETVIGDERYLRQILHHLLRNAIKFTNQGQIKLAARLERSEGATRLVLSVTDTGIGIPAEKLRVIFQSFRQLDAGLARSYSGLGLGLALSDKLARLMGGEIHVSSEVGIGSIFTVRVPLGIPAAAAVQHTHQGGSQKPRILVVEDNRIAQQVVRHVLNRAGCQVSFASSGEEGIQRAAAEPVDLIFMDLQMPGKDGFSAARAIQQLPARRFTPIIALAANYSDEHRAMCAQVGMQGFLSKPIQRDEILRTLQEHSLLPAPTAETTVIAAH